MKNILVIGDVHLKPGAPNEHMTWLGNLIVTRQPDVVLQIGDLGDFPSLSSYDKGKKSGEGHRYVNDVDSVLEGLSLLHGVVDDYNKGRKKKYLPEFKITLGNHDQGRSDRAANDDAALFGAISWRDMQLVEHGWDVTAFRSVLNVEGVNFSHYFPSGAMDRAISGINVGRSLMNKQMESCLQGHSHTLNYSSDTTVSGKRFWGGSVGCYIHPSQREDYASDTTQLKWFKGVLVLHDTENGDFDPEAISMKRIIKEYA